MFRTSNIFSRIPASLFVLLALLAACSREPEPLPAIIVHGTTGEMLEERLSPYLEEAVRRYGLPGLAVGVVSGDETVYARAWGYGNVEAMVPLTIRSNFHLASNSKPFVATAVMQLAEAGKIDLDDPVVRYLHYFKLAYGSYNEITVRQMLSHHSGMPDIRDYKWDHPEKHEHALEDYVRSIAREGMIAEPGEQFSYSSMAYECLGDLVAKVAGMPFEEYVNKRILDPLGMEESTLLMPDSIPGDWAMPHARVIRNRLWDHYPYNRMHGPSSTMHSSVVEMCRWAMFNLNRGILDGKRILGTTSFDLLFEPRYPTGEGNYMGLCWFIGEHRDHRAIHHSGGDTGFTTNLVLMPEDSVAVVVLCNTQPAPVEILSAAALDILLGYEPEPLKTPASFPVSDELYAHGQGAAVTLWDSLRTNHAEAYDFGANYFYGLMNAMKLDLVEEAESLFRLCLEIHTQETLDFLMGQAQWYRDFHMPNNAARAVIRLMREHGRPPDSK